MGNADDLNSLKTLAFLYLSIALISMSAAQTIPSNVATIVAAVVRGSRGTTVGVPLSIQNEGGVSGVQFDLTFLPDNLNALTLEIGTLSSNIIVRSTPLTPGVLRILAYSADGSAFPTNSGVGTVPFSIPDGTFLAGGEVGISNAIVSLVDSESAEPLGLRSGAILVMPSFRSADGTFFFTLNVQSNINYSIQETTNLIIWSSIGSAFANGDYIAFADSGATNMPYRFYRAVTNAGP